MVHNHREQPPRGRGGRIPVRVTTLRRPGLRSGGPPPEPAVEVEPPRPITIRIPAMGSNREVLPTAPTAAAVDTSEIAPPRYERVAPESITVPRSKDELSAVDAESENPREDHAEGTGEVPQRVPIIKEEEGEPSRRDTGHEVTAVASRADLQMNRRKNPDPPAPREEAQRAQVTLDPETAEMIRQIAQEQRELRTEVRDMRQELFEVRVTVKTHDIWLDQVFKRVGDVIDDQWGLRATVEEIKKFQETAGARSRTQTSAQTPIRAGPGPQNTNARSEGSPRLRTSPVTDIESLYASEEGNHPEQGARGTWNRERDDLVRQPEVNNRAGRHQDTVETPGEAWIRRRNGQRFGLGTEEALERWHAASEVSRERRASRQQRVPEPQQQRRQEPRDLGSDQAREPRRSVTQPHEVGFGRRPSLQTPSGGEQQASGRGHQPSGGSGSESSDDSQRGGGGPDRRSRRGSSHVGDRSQTGSRASSKRTTGDEHSSKRRRR